LDDDERGDRAIANGWLALHESGTYVKFTEAGAQVWPRIARLISARISARRLGVRLADRNCTSSATASRSKAVIKRVRAGLGNNLG
jgi:hypothetical protein